MRRLIADIKAAAKFWVACGGLIVTAIMVGTEGKLTWLPVVASAVTAIAIRLVPNATPDPEETRDQNRV